MSRKQTSNIWWLLGVGIVVGAIVWFLRRPQEVVVPADGVAPVPPQLIPIILPFPVNGRVAPQPPGPPRPAPVVTPIRPAIVHRPGPERVIASPEILAYLARRREELRRARERLIARGIVRPGEAVGGMLPGGFEVDGPREVALLTP